MTTAIETSVSRETNLATVQVVSTPPVSVPDGKTVVYWSRRSTEKNPVKAEERYRGVVINAAAIKLPDGATISKFSVLLQETINGLANAKFEAWVKDRMLETQMPEATITVDSVLAFWAEEKQRSTIDGAAILEWLKASETLKALPEATAKVWLTKVPKIAAPSYKSLFTKGQAAAIVAKLAVSEIDHPVAILLATRCNIIIMDQSQEEAL